MLISLTSSKTVCVKTHFIEESNNCVCNAFIRRNNVESTFLQVYRSIQISSTLGTLIFLWPVLPVTHFI
jgi:hypothetical protein